MFPLLYGLDKEVIRELARATEYRLVSEGKFVCVHGHAPDACFLILRGKVRPQHAAVTSSTRLLRRGESWKVLVVC